jgi:DICT domain-containing protein
MNSEATLNQLKTTLPEGQMPSSYGVYFKNTLVALCHALEDYILEQSDGVQKPLVLVTFQQGKWYLQEADRYSDIANRSQRVAIAAVPDSGFGDHATSRLANVDLIDLKADDSLTEEWNLIILAPGYAAMVLCHELSEADYRSDSVPAIDVERKFYGLWTFERGPVEAAAKILLDRMQPYDHAVAAQLTEYYNVLKNNPSGTPTDLSGVVSRIVNYLQSSQQQLVTVSRQTRELWELEGQASKLNRNLAANKLQAFLRMAQKIDARDPANRNEVNFGKIREPVLRFVQWARAFDAGTVTPEHTFPLYNTTFGGSLAQAPYKSPSVFNFYRPGYVAPGTETGAAGLTMPELQLVNANSISNYANFMTYFIFAFAANNVGDASATSFIPDYSDELALADDPAALVDHLDLLLTYGTTSDETKATIITFLEDIGLEDPNDPNYNGPFLRVALGVLMMMTSPDYTVQR